MSPPSNANLCRDAVSKETGQPFFDTLAIVGVGLLGGSVALAARQKKLVRRVIGIGRNAARLEQARAAGVVDDVSTDVAAVAAQSDLIIFALPVDRIAAAAREAAVHCRPGTLLTDVGSTKAQIAREVSGQLPSGVIFIGSHPLAGSEKTGWEHARADLFDGRVGVVTPASDTPPEPLSRLMAFWSQLGMTVNSLSPELHDRILAQTSHVPHVVASALARTLADDNRPFAATGFADTTRIAAGDSDVWMPILLQNATAVIGGLDEFTAEIAAYREALARRDANALKALWERGRHVRTQLGHRARRASPE